MQSRTNSSSGTRRGKQPRRLFVDRAMQWRLAGFAAVTVSLVSIFTCICMFGILQQQARARLLASAGADPWTNTKTLLLYTGLVTTFMAVGAAGWTIAVTRRIYGPIAAVNGFLEPLRQGRFPAFRPLRKKDGFTAFFTSFWETIDVLKSWRRAEIRTLDEVLQLAHSAAGADDISRKRDMATLHTLVSSLREQLHDSLGDDSAMDPVVKTGPAGTDEERSPNRRDPANV